MFNLPWPLKASRTAGTSLSYLAASYYTTTSWHMLAVFEITSLRTGTLLQQPSLLQLQHRLPQQPQLHVARVMI